MKAGNVIDLLRGKRLKAAAALAVAVERGISVATESLLDNLDPATAFGLWGYDLRGSWVLEFSALIAEGHHTYDAEWDRPGWRYGVERWHGGERMPIPYIWALPWVWEFPPSRSMWLPPDAGRAEDTNG